MRLASLLFEIDFSVGCICCIKSEMFTGVSMHAMYVQLLSIHPSIHRIVVYKYVCCVLCAHYSKRNYNMWMAINDMKVSSIFVKSTVGDGDVNEQRSKASFETTEERERERERASQHVCTLYAWCVRFILYVIFVYMSLENRQEKI